MFFVTTYRKNKALFYMDLNRLLPSGCGHGLPGLAVLLSRRHDPELLSRTFLIFQDLNKEALDNATLSTAFFTLRQFFPFQATLGKAFCSTNDVSFSDVLGL